MKIGELFLQIGIKADTATLNRVNESFRSMRRAVTEIQVAFAAAVYGLDRFVSGTVDGVTALQSLNAQTGLSIDLIQKWQQAGQKSNLALTAESIASSIGNLQKNLAAIKLGQGDVSPFQLLGIDINNRDAFGVLEQIRKNIGGLPNDIASNLISQLGLDPNFISILRLSNEEFEKLGRNSMLGKGGRAAVMATGLAIRNLKLNLQQLKDQAVAKLAPVLNDMIQKFFVWMNKNSGKIVTTIVSIVNAIRSFSSALGNALSIAQKFIEDTIGMQNGIKALTIVFGALALSFRPVLLGLFLIIGLLDDIQIWSKGGKSLFGDFYSSIAKLGKNLKPLMDAFKGFKDTVKEAFDFDEKTEKNLDKLNSFFNGAKEALQGAAIGALIGFLTGGAGGAIKGAAIGGGVDIFAQIIAGQKALLDQFGKKRIGDTVVDNETFRKARENQGIEKSRIINNNVNIQVDGSSDPKSTAKAVSDELKNSQNVLNNGGF